MIGLLLIDDHPIVRAGLRAVLERSEEVRVLGEAADGPGGIEAAAILRPDVVLCDLRLGEGMDGIETTRRLRALPAAPAVVMLSTFDRGGDVLRAIEAGAAGYLVKEAPTTQILEALAAAARGGTVFSPGLARRAAELRPIPGLTEREREVLGWVARGHSNREISRELFVSETTVKTHVAHLLAKLSASSRAQAVSIARGRGLIE